MAGGKHPAIRLGLSIVAVLVCAPPVSVLDQAPSAATFRILENGSAIGSAEIAVARDEDGWRVQSTSRAPGTIGLDVPLSRSAMTRRGACAFYRWSWRGETRDAHREARSMQPLMRCVTRKCERRAGPFRRDECHCSSFEIPTPIEIWVAQGALLKLELPLDHLVLIRSDILD